MKLFPLLLLLINVVAALMLREAVPALRNRGFLLSFSASTLVACVPWVAMALVGWRAGRDAFGEATAPLWFVSIAWHVSVMGLALAWPLWRPALFLASSAVERLPLEPERRAFLQSLSVLVPVGALSVGTGGVVAAVLSPRVRRVTLNFPDLPAALQGFKIGQFSDVHVGTFITPRHVRAAVDALNQEQVDLVAMTGDLVDDASQMPAINEAFRGVTARHGILGVLGNHEYYAGLPAYLKHVAKGPMKLLVDQGTTLDHDGARIHVSGVDYPFHGMDGPPEAAAHSMAQAMKGAQDGDFKLCLAHHPTCWDQARAHGAHLTLAGHTHGGQVAVAGRSVFQSWFRYMMGLYEDGAQRLFVTSGLGHWLPFRVGCPPEVVVVELRRGPVSAPEA